MSRCAAAVIIAQLSCLADIAVADITSDIDLHCFGKEVCAITSCCANFAFIVMCYLCNVRRLFNAKKKMLQISIQVMCQWR